MLRIIPILHSDLCHPRELIRILELTLSLSLEWRAVLMFLLKRVPWGALSLLLVPATLLVCGCSEAEPRLYPASGVVTFNNQPTPNAELVFHPQFDGPGWMPVAKADEHGAFDVSTKLPGDGALPGRYLVTVPWHAVADDPESPNRLPARYADPKTSGLEVSLGPESSDLPPFKLTDK